MNNFLDDSDFIQIGKIIKSELPESGFLSECSVKYISCFYKAISVFESTILTGVKKNNQLIGFAFYTTDKNTYYKEFFLKTHIKSLLYPSCYFPLAKALIKRKNSLKKKYRNELVQIAVNGNYIRKGIGTELIALGEKELMLKKINKYYLQVEKENYNAVTFYTKIGFMRIEEFEAAGKNKYLMEKVL